MAFTLPLKLNQHTPLLHFQHEQEGATLRTTELKPKLDQFIVKTRGEGILKTHGADPEDGDKEALNYKLRISAEVAEEYVVASFIPRDRKEDLQRVRQKFLSDAPYFADNPLIKDGKWSEARRAVMYKNIQVEIFSFHEDLVGWVEEALPRVLAYENFGTRQSKGFGSFSVDGTSQADFERYLLDNAHYKKALFYTFDTPKPSLSDIFRKIDNEYKILKSGFAKERSQLLLYFEEKGIRWEKPAIKENLVKGRGIKDLSGDEKQKFIRAFLGLAELYEFPQDRAKVNIDCFDKDGAPKEPIDRFRSPITFKVFGNAIYMLTNPIPPALYNRSFRFYNHNGEVIINTPPESANFDLNEFLDQYAEKSWKYVGEQ